MKRLLGVLLVIGSIWVFVASCASTRIQPLAPGELKLVKLAIPEAVVQNLPYDVAVVFEENGHPQIKKACLRLYAQKAAASPTANLICFSKEVEANKQVSTECRPWEPPYSRISPASCTDIQSVKYGERNYFLVRIEPNFLKPEYNKLECHVEYISDGQLRQSNKVSAPIRIEY